MLVHCPKCNFSQPKDTYCANCGIEMDSYKPEKTPFIKALIKNPITHIVLFIVAVVFGYVTYKDQLNLNSSEINQASNNTSSKKFDPQKDQVKKTAELTATNDINPDSAEKNEAAPPGSAPSAATAVSPTTAVDNSAHSPMGAVNTDSEHSASAVTSAAATNGPWTLQVRYIDLSTQTYQQWVAEAQKLEAYAEMTDFVMGKVAKSQKTFGKVIDNSTKNFSDLKASKLFSGSLNSDTGIEQTINFKFNIAQENAVFQGDFDINEEDAAGANKKQFASGFEIKPTEILFIKGSSPRNSGKSDAADSEFLIIFDFQSSH